MASKAFRQFVWRALQAERVTSIVMICLTGLRPGLVSPKTQYGHKKPFSGFPHTSHSAWSSMRTGIFFMQGLREILVAAITSQRVEPVDRNVICLMCALGYAASYLRNPAQLQPM